MKNYDKKTIGILTFHWANNYGAVLQAFALQKKLNMLGYHAEIIDYIPFTFKKNIFKHFISRYPRRILFNFLNI